MSGAAAPSRGWGAFAAGNAVASRALTVLLGVVSSIALARGLGSEGRGRFAIAAAVLGIGVQVVTLGLYASLPYYAARAPGAARGLLAAGARWMALASVAFGLAVAGWAALGEPDWYRDCGPTLTLIALASVPAAGLQLLSQATLLGLGRTTLYCWVEPASRVVMVIVVLGLLWAGTLSPSTALAASGLVALATGIWVAASIDPGTGVVPRFGEQWHYMWKSAVIALLASMPPRVLTLALSTRVPVDEVGHWGVALTVVETLNSIAASVIAVRKVPLLLHQGGGPAFWQSAIRGVASIFTLAVLVCAVAYFAMPLLMRLAFGEKFLPAAGIVLACLPGVLAYSMSAMFQVIHAARGQPAVAFAAPVAAVAATGALLALPWTDSAISLGWVFTAQASIAMAVSAAVTVRAYRHRDRAVSRQP